MQLLLSLLDQHSNQGNKQWDLIQLRQQVLSTLVPLSHMLNHPGLKASRAPITMIVTDNFEVQCETGLKRYVTCDHVAEAILDEL